MNMATLKIISDSDCHVFIDMEPRCDIKANTLCKLSLNKGTYIIDCVHINQVDRVSLDYTIDEENTEYLLRVKLERQGAPQKQSAYACYDKIEPFCNGLAKVRIGKLWGYIDTDKKIIVPCIYDDIGGFNEGLAACKSNEHWGFVDMHGKEVIPLIYDDVGKCKGGYIPICQKEWGEMNMAGDYGLIEKWGIINIENIMMISPQYHCLYHTECAGIFFAIKGTPISKWRVEINIQNESLSPATAFADWDCTEWTEVYNRVHRNKYE